VLGIPISHHSLADGEQDCLRSMITLTKKITGLARHVVTVLQFTHHLVPHAFVLISDGEITTASVILL
jgi:hypothetical protein